MTNPEAILPILNVHLNGHFLTTAQLLDHEFYEWANDTNFA